MNCKECGVHSRVRGEMYDTRERNVIGSLEVPIRVAEGTDTPPGTVFFFVPNTPQTQNGQTLVNIDVVQYVCLDRIPEPLRELVKNILDATNSEETK